MVNRVKKAGRWVGAVKTGYHSLMGKELSQAANKRAVSALEAAPPAGSFARGGVVKKTGLAKVHRGEHVLTAKEAAMIKKLLH